MEAKVEEFLKDHKQPYTTNEVAGKLDIEFNSAMQALYNLRNAEKIYKMTFDTKEINWVHRTHFGH